MAVVRDGGAPLVSQLLHKRCGGRARGARQDKRKVGGESTPALAIASSAKERYCSRKRQDVPASVGREGVASECYGLRSGHGSVGDRSACTGRPSSWEPWRTWRTLFWRRCDVDESCSLIVIDFGVA
jgi:hypothetical protein